MDQLPQFGTAISQIALPTFKTFLPLVSANAEAIQSTSRQTHPYGPNPRQALDVYTPSSSASKNPSSPILVFFYGGGLVRGDKILPQSNGLWHANIGHFFAEKYGFTTVIPDYRLISHGAKFPSGGQDVSLVVKWVKENLQDEKGQTRELFMMGNSAGGIHLSTYLLATDFADSRKDITSTSTKIQLKGCVFLSVPFHFEQADPSRYDTMNTYFGDFHANCPMALLKSALGSSNGDPFDGLPIFVLNGSLDPEDEILIPKKDFLAAWDEGASNQAKSTLKVDMMEGQNHLSPALSLGTAREAEEAWGHQVIDFCKSTMTSSQQ